MTDPERVEEPRPDRLPQIKQRLAYIGVWYGGDLASKVDISWLVAEVERLRAELAKPLFTNINESDLVDID